MSDNSQSVTTRLLTLLNVSATKAGKRKWSDTEQYIPAQKLNKRKIVNIAGPALNTTAETLAIEPEVASAVTSESKEDEGTLDDSTDPYETHFGIHPAALTENSRASIDSHSLKQTKLERHGIGHVNEEIPESTSVPIPSFNPILERLRGPFKSKQARQSKDRTNLQNGLLSTLSGYQDLYMTSSSWETKEATREATSLHLLNHVMKKRRRILKNNERLAHASKAGSDAPEDIQDQGFTRPSVLILLPFRSSALSWFHALTMHTPAPAFQIENQSRFLSEYGLPPGAVDKLATANAGAYPRDHIETFKGNVDDSFRVGIKLTRKSVKVFSEFYGSDIIIASPLGLRQSIQKEKNSDYLSSIEIVIADQLEALTMQNWEHFKFVIDLLNQMPKESHDTDFSRIKPWYLDGQAAYLRQTVLFTSLETPETRALFNGSLKNVAGRLRTEKKWGPIEVPAGIEQDFTSFDCASPLEEADKRFQHFTTNVFPSVLKSAVQSANTIVFIPSSFDFIRVHNHFRKQSGLSFTVLSEYSTNQEISRARQAFFLGKVSFLLISERFHFYRRYKLRGIRNLVFYGPPDHPEFYSEFLAYPFLDEGVESADVTCRVLYSKYDWFRLERIAGTEGALEIMGR